MQTFERGISHRSETTQTKGLNCVKSGRSLTSYNVFMTVKDIFTALIILGTGFVFTLLVFITELIVGGRVNVCSSNMT